MLFFFLWASHGLSRSAKVLATKINHLLFSPSLVTVSEALQRAFKNAMRIQIAFKNAMSIQKPDCSEGPGPIRTGWFGLVG